MYELRKGSQKFEGST